MSRAAVLLLFLLLAPLAEAAELVRGMPGHAEQGEELTVTLRLEGLAPGMSAIISELVPEGAEILSWHVEGAERVQFVREEFLIWEFTATSEQPAVTYLVRLPTEGSSAQFDAVYALPTEEVGQSKLTMTLTAPLTPEAAPLEPVASPAPVTEEPAPVSSSGFLLPILLIVLLVLAVPLYLESRRREYLPGSSFVDWAGRAAERFLMKPTPVMDEQGKKLDLLAQRQDRLIRHIEEYQEHLPFHDDAKAFQMLEDLKGELRSISFIRKTL